MVTIRHKNKKFNKVKDKNKSTYDRERIVYTAFLIALLTYLNEKNLYRNIENHLDDSDLILLQDIWGYEHDSMIGLLEEQWDRRKKQ